MKRILIVDDEIECRASLEAILSHKGYVTEEAISAEDAFKELKKSSFDLILLDVRMPDMDGLQALQEIRRQGYKTPVIIYSGYSDEESVKKAKQFGASRYIEKPFDYKQWPHVFNQVLKEDKYHLQHDYFDKRLGRKVIQMVRSDREKTSKTLDANSAIEPIIATPSSTVTFHLDSQKMTPRMTFFYMINIDIDVLRKIKILGWLLLTALVLLSSFVGRMIWKNSVPSLPSTQVIDTPFKNISAISWYKNDLWLTDWLTQSIIQSEIIGNNLIVKKSIRLPQFQLTGLCFVRDNLYTCDASQQLINKHRMDDQLTVVESYKSPGPNPSALYWDGHFLWSTDSSTKKIYKHSITPTFATIESYPSAGESPVGIFSNGTFLWTADSRTQKIYRYKIDKKLTPLNSYFISELTDIDNPLSAFTIYDGNIYITKERVGSIWVKNGIL